MKDFIQELQAFYAKLGTAKKMVLATSYNNRVTARMMSCIILDKTIYMQTDKNFLKYEQMSKNPLVALCIDNVQIEGIASFDGHPLDDHNIFFAELYESNYKSAFDLYSSLPCEILIKVVPIKITLWEYEEKKPYRIFFDIKNEIYAKEFYAGQ